MEGRRRTAFPDVDHPQSSVGIRMIFFENFVTPQAARVSVFLKKLTFPTELNLRKALQPMHSTPDRPPLAPAKAHSSKAGSPASRPRNSGNLHGAAERRIWLPPTQRNTRTVAEFPSTRRPRRRPHVDAFASRLRHHSGRLTAVCLREIEVPLERPSRFYEALRSPVAGIPRRLFGGLFKDHEMLPGEKIVGFFPDKSGGFEFLADLGLAHFVERLDRHLGVLGAVF